MEKGKKSKESLVVIILIILLLGACAYIGYDKFFVKEDNQVNNSNKNKGVEKLDVNSRLVQSLYNRVSTGELKKEDSTCLINYMYEDDNNFYASTAKEEIKMKIIGRLLSDSGKHGYSDDESIIPATIPNYGDYESIISINKKYGGNSIEYYYDRNYIENLYKEIFGSSAKLDTSIGIKMGSSEIEMYYYVPSIDKYVLYTLEGGGCSKVGSARVEVEKATKNGKELKIYEKVTMTNLNDDIIDAGDTTNSNYVYTFELEDDGMYKFVSRVKED